MKHDEIKRIRRDLDVLRTKVVDTIDRCRRCISAGIDMTPELTTSEEQLRVIVSLLRDVVGEVDE